MPPEESLGRERRVRKRQDFLRIQSSKRKMRSRHFVLALAKPRVDSQESRIGITITTKVDKRAARRNRLKRRIKEFYRKQRRFLAERLDMVVIALDGATELDFREVSWELKGLLLKTGLLKRGRQS